MNEHDSLPNWAHAQIRSTQEKIEFFSKKLKLYNQQLVVNEKARVLGDSFSILTDIESIARRYKFFTNYSGLQETRISMELEAAELKERGFPVQFTPQPAVANVLFVDTETTGLSQADQPVSIGAVLSEVEIHTGSIHREVTSYYGLRDPSCEINSSAFRVHGLTKSNLRGLEFDFCQLVSMFGVADLIVAHNAKFDRRMLRFLGDENYNWGCSCWDVDWPKEIRGFSLDAICSYFSVAREEPHNSMSDTRTMMAVLQQRKDDDSTYLAQLLEKCGIRE